MPKTKTNTAWEQMSDSLEKYAKAIFQYLEPALEKKYVNGAWVYETSEGQKSKEEIIKRIKLF